MTNTLWSDCIQNTGTLYLSRMLRFDDRYREAYTRAFDIGQRQNILEIGCGPGALAQSLARWYPHACVTGVDRDTAFIRFATQQAPHIRFTEADATALPYADASFDVTVSNTVQEHIEPSAFFGEQFRVLKPGGVCLVLSARRGIHIPAACVAEESAFEREIWERAAQACPDVNRKYHVGQYAMSETELPRAMESYGFRQVSTRYLTVNLTPDNPENAPEFAHAIFNAQRQTAIDAVNALAYTAPGVVSDAEIAELRRRIHAKYDRRVALYDAGEKQWDTSMSLTMVLRGVKQAAAAQGA